MYKVMIVEDNSIIRNELSSFLSHNGYETECPTCFDQIPEIVKRNKPHLVLLDLTLPVVDGHVICRQIRKESDVPIIIVTSRDSDLDELLSLNLGADDFITKPYHLQVLLAHMARVLNRVYESGNGNVLHIGEVVLDISKSILSYKEESIDLTKNELRIMHCLFQHKNQIVSRNALMQHMWDCELFVDDNTLTVNINRLRKKLEYLHLDDFIVTKRGLGYIVYETH